MTNDQEIKLLLIRIIELLNLGDYADWGRLMKKLLYKISTDPKDTMRDILSLYGGMGSFNDIVLHQNKIPLKEENEELSILRSRLFNLCINGLAL